MHNPIIAIPSLSTVVTYDILNRALVLVRCGRHIGDHHNAHGAERRSGEGIDGGRDVVVSTMPIDLHPRNLISPRPVGMTQLRDETTLAL